MTITVKELKEFLATIDDDRIVVLAEDAEGNGYSPLKGCWEGRIVLTTHTQAMLD